MTAYYNEFDPFAASWLEECIKDGLIAPGVVDRRSIEDVVPSDLKGYTQCHFFAGIGVWSLALRIAGWSDDRPIWTGSCPCFPAGTLVLTRRGLLPIEHVVRGDMVLTHMSRWRRVTAVGSEFSETVTVKGQGHWGLVTTPGHPFYARTRQTEYRRSSADYGKVVLGTREWVRADNLSSKSWATIAHLPEEPVPALESAEFARFLGFFVGNGWVSGSRVFVCDHVGSATDLLDLVAPVTDAPRVENGRTGDKVAFTDAKLAAWLKDEFGHGASNKRIPTWLLTAPLSFVREFTIGWFAADGHRERSADAWVTTSRNLAIGLRILLNRLGRAVSIRRVNSPTNHTIEGRTVNTHPWFRITASDRTTSFKFDGGHGWGAVRNVKPSNVAVRVYNMSVEEDESYTADGIVVHNCQPFSAAGKGDGFDDERHLWPAFHWHIAHGKPADVPVIGEQVASKAGRAWFDLVQSDMEALDHACGAVDTSAAGNGAPFIGQRLYWLAKANQSGSQRRLPVERGWREDQCAVGADGVVGGMAQTMCTGWPEGRAGAGDGSVASSSSRGLGQADQHQSPPIAGNAGEVPQVPAGQRADERTVLHERAGGICGLAASASTGPFPSTLREIHSGEGGAGSRDGEPERPGNFGGLATSHSEQHDRTGEPGQAGRSESPNRCNTRDGIPLHPIDFWSDPDWLLCRDPDGARFRPVEPSTLIMANGRTVRWRMAESSGEGNQIQTHFPLAQAKEYLNRLDEVRGAGNALNVAQAANFIAAVMEYLNAHQ